MNSQTRVPLTVTILTKNEASRLPDCLKSVAWANEIVVLDDESSDETGRIAEQFGAKVFHRRMDIEGKQRNYALSKATQPWILTLDADERVSAELAQELQAALSRQTHLSGFAMPVKTYLGKRWIKAAGYYPATRLRLFRHGALRYEEAEVHPKVFFEGKRAFLKSDIIHYGYRDLTHFVDKINRQTELEARKWVEDKRPMGFWRMFRKMLDRFSRNYFRKKGNTDGFLGFLMSVFHGMYQFMTYVKYLELKRDHV